MVVSINRGTPIWTPKFYNPYYGDLQKGTPNFRKNPDRGRALGLVREFPKLRGYRTFGGPYNKDPTI